MCKLGLLKDEETFNSGGKSARFPRAVESNEVMRVLICKLFSQP